MVPLKGKTNVRQIKVTEVRGPSKSAVSKFKIYSENDKVNAGIGDDVDYRSSRTSLLSKKGTRLTNKTVLKDTACGAEETRGDHGSLDKMKVLRKALADVSNVRVNQSKAEKPGASRKSMTFGTLTSTASSSQPLVRKAKAYLTRGATAASHTSVKASTTAVKTSLISHRVQVHETVGKITRQNSRSSNTVKRNSISVLKRASQLGASELQGDVRSAEKSTRKLGFPVKTKVGGVLSQASNLQGRVPNYRVSDGFICTAPKNQPNKDAPPRLRKSLKPAVRIPLQASNAPKTFKNNSLSSLDKSLGRTSARRAKVASSSIGSAEEVTDGGILAEGSDNIEPKMLETTASKRSSRRKSYTSLLISRSKLLGQSNENLEQEKLPNIDDKGNPLEVAEYVDDIYEYYWIIEAQSASLANYMMNQTDVTPQMRGILINWLIEVHHKFDLMPETLYLTVALLDRYLSLVSIRKKEMQLVGLTSLLLASKYEDFWHPRVKDLVNISAETYTRNQMLQMEKDILKKLKFRLNLPTAYVFMLRFLKASQSDKQFEHLAFYLIELCLIDYEALRFKPSLLCAAAVYVARITLNKGPAWTSLLRKHTRYEEHQIRDCAKMILRIHKAASAALLKVTYDKYMRPEFGKVAAIRPLDCLPL